MAIINKIIHNSVVDGPGNRAAIFLQECNYRCSYCHNPETIKMCTSCGICVSQCPTGALSMEKEKVIWKEESCCECDTCIHVCPNLSSPRTKNYTARQVMDEIEVDIPFIRGITVSGGECTLHRDFLYELFRLARKRGLNTLIDSNGSYDYSQDEALLKVCDGIMLDVKACDREAHFKLTGADNALVLKNALFLAEHEKLEEIRTVIVPDYLPNEETVDSITKMLSPYLKSRDIRYKLIAYRPFGVRSPYRETLRTPGEPEMQYYKKVAEKNGFKNIILI